ncbi:MAG: serine/threonine-protein kinase [Candidatus Zixiibacteriota bacterium]
MAADNETVRDDGGGSSPDPLGIIGWVIGGKYKIEAYISGGGFGEVYAGYNQHLPEQRVVVKFFKRVQSREKFDKEARILCQLDHPNISRVIDYLPDEGAAVVAFIDGEDGGNYLKTKGALPENLYLNVARSMSKAIAYAHEKKIAHRDLKPGNILIDKNGQVFLIDFGIAKEIGGDATKTAYTALTPMFAAPERQAGDKDYNPFLSDIYEMGVTLFNFATNSLPYRNPVNPNFGEWGGKASEVLSPDLRKILLKATHPDPDRRYISAKEMADDFDKLKHAYKTKGSSPLKYILIVILIAVLGFAGYEYRDEIMSQYERLTASTKRTDKPEKPKDQPTMKDSIAGGEMSAVQDSAQVTADNSAQIVASVQDTSQEAAPVVEPPKTEPKKEEPVQPKPKEEEKPAPPPEPEDSEILIMVSPFENSTLLVNNRPWTSGSSKVLPQGTYAITVINPDYPIYSEKLTARKKNENINIVLAQKFRSLKLVDIQVALAPHSDRHFLDISFNGKEHKISRFPALDLRKGAGKWQVGLSLNLLGDASGQSQPKIDSCVTFPYGGGPRSVIKGDSGTLTLETDKSSEGGPVPMVIFWSEEK